MNTTILKTLPFADFIVRKINGGVSRSVNIKKNIALDFFIKGLNIGTNLMLVPLTINYLSPVKYGIWLTISSFIAWFGFFDIGLTHGFRNHFTMALAKKEIELARIYVSTTYFILTAVFAGVLLVFLPLNYIIDWNKLLNINQITISELRNVIAVVFTFFCLKFVIGMITTILAADQKPALNSFYNTLGNVVSLAIIFIVTKISNGDLIYLCFIYSVIPVMILLYVSFFYFRNKYKEFSPSIKFIKLKYAKDLFGLGMNFFFISIGTIVLFNTNNIIITKLFGPEEVTPYNILYKYYNIAYMFFAIVITPFWSAFTDAYALKDITWIKKAIRKIQAIWVLLTLLIITLFLVDKFIIRLWIGSQIKFSSLLSMSVALYFIVYIWQTIYIHFLNGVSKVRLQLISLVIATAIHIPLSIFLAKRIGISGIILSQVFLFTIMSMLFYIQYLKIVSGKAEHIWNK